MDNRKYIGMDVHQIKAWGRSPKVLWTLTKSSPLAGESEKTEPTCAGAAYGRVRTVDLTSWREASSPRIGHSRALGLAERQPEVGEFS